MQEYRSQASRCRKEHGDMPDIARLLSNCRLAARLAGIVAVCVGLAVLVGGWALGITSLIIVGSGFAAMRPNTALGLLLCGAALWLDFAGQAMGAKRLWAQMCAGLVGL